MNLSRSASLLALASTALSAQAGSYTFTGSIDRTDPKFRRPHVLFNGASIVASTLLREYDQYLFSVTTSGTYSFTTPDVGSLDPYTFLYLGAMNPADAIANVLTGDAVGLGLGVGSFFTYDLTVGTTYSYLITNYNATRGSYAATISGPGDVLRIGASSVPGPTAALPFALMALRRRKRA